MKTLPERYQKVVSLYYSAEMTMKEIGLMLDVNESRISQIHKKALEKMAITLRAVGILSCDAFSCVTAIFRRLRNFSDSPKKKRRQRHMRCFQSANTFPKASSCGITLVF
jgi:hypothetical protein